MSGTLKGAIDLGLVPRIVDLHGDALGGRLDMDMTLAGTLAAPRFAGDAHLAGGSYASADAGTVLREVNAVIAGDDARIRLQSLTAGDGDKGRLSASGTVTLLGAESARLRGELNLEHFTILNRSDAMAVASGRLQLSDEAQGARLGGEVTVGVRRAARAREAAAEDRQARRRRSECAAGEGSARAQEGGGRASRCRWRSG